MAAWTIASPESLVNPFKWGASGNDHRPYRWRLPHYYCPPNRWCSRNWPLCYVRVLRCPSQIVTHSTRGIRWAKEVGGQEEYGRHEEVEQSRHATRGGKLPAPPGRRRPAARRGHAGPIPQEEAAGHLPLRLVTLAHSGVGWRELGPRVGRVAPRQIEEAYLALYLRERGRG